MITYVCLLFLFAYAYIVWLGWGGPNLCYTPRDPGGPVYIVGPRGATRLGCCSFPRTTRLGCCRLRWQSSLVCMYCMCIVVRGILRNSLSFVLQLWTKYFSGTLFSRRKTKAWLYTPINSLMNGDSTILFFINLILNYSLWTKGFVLNISLWKMCTYYSSKMIFFYFQIWGVTRWEPIDVWQ